jgi:predicted  nucleic acid-binding Zn-ribbon protein
MSKLMLRRLALLLGCIVAFNAAAQGLFDDNEARRRIEALRQEFSQQQREVNEQLKKLDAAVSSASDRSALLQLATQVENLNNQLANMRGQLEVLGNQM